MVISKFLTFEELVKDHERLVGEVEELKKNFESHVHDGGSGMIGVTTGKAKSNEPAKCVDCGAILTGKEKVVCSECTPF